MKWAHNTFQPSISAEAVFTVRDWLSVSQMPSKTLSYSSHLWSRIYSCLHLEASQWTRLFKGRGARAPTLLPSVMITVSIININTNCRDYVTLYWPLFSVALWRHYWLRRCGSRKVSWRHSETHSETCRLTRLYNNVCTILFKKVHFETMLAKWW